MFESGLPSPTFFLPVFFGQENGSAQNKGGQASVENARYAGEKTFLARFSNSPARKGAPRRAKPDADATGRTENAGWSTAFGFLRKNKDREIQLRKFRILFSQTNFLRECRKRMESLYLAPACRKPRVVGILRSDTEKRPFRRRTLKKKNRKFCFCRKISIQCTKRIV